ncbi:hypothetical protein IQ10_00097 [Halalkalibacter nanhaiisediminis]|uniref:Paeninodin family lasso peptide n=1 Tax=Halalkalibacter nanhaiisediminis TaxID=688079 RepID=A0A562QSK7_9BACI|nr:hypothetical protein IQ10_00097 [Halalkalibacter nanhaiisediminis]
MMRRVKKEWKKPVLEILDVNMTMKFFEHPKKEKPSKQPGEEKDPIEVIMES